MSPARRPRETLEQLLRAALDAVAPARVLPRVLTADRRLRIGGERLAEGARLRVLAAGKAAAAMAAFVEEIASGSIAGGIVVTKDGHGLSAGSLPVLEAGHPVPDARSEAAGRAFLREAGAGSDTETLLVLLSGGASALLATPLAGLTRDDIARTTALLLASGAPIDELNCVRKHLCDVAGGRLARAARGRNVFLLAISDVPGDRLDVIGSGPCTADPSRYADALEVLRSRGILASAPAAVRSALETGARGEREESPKPGDASLARVRARVVASNADALAAALAAAGGLGLRPVALGAPLVGEASRAGRRLAALGRSLDCDRPTLVAAGGETTVTLRGMGRGGRNQELALAAALELEGVRGVSLLAAGTDGTDGPTDAAGAFADGTSVARGRATGRDARADLERNDSNGFFAAEGGLVMTGPTQTNVMDVALLLREPGVS